MRQVLIWILLVGCTACNSTPKTGADTQGASALVATTTGYAPLQYSARRGGAHSEDWCAAEFSTPVMVSADSKDYSKRLFYMSDAVHQVVVGYGNNRASLFLQKNGPAIDVFTGQHWPNCLSLPQNSKITNGSILEYNNGQTIQFDLKVRTLAEGLQAELDLPEQPGFGLVVRTCTSCY